MNLSLGTGLFILTLLFCWSLYAKFDQPFYLSPEKARQVGHQIWQNECGKRVEGLTTWNPGEEFASLGIGHFIWYPQSYTGPFKETFPDFIVFLKQNEVPLPSWLVESSYCPWETGETFRAAQQDPRMLELRHILLDTIDWQIVFMINRLHRALPGIVLHVPQEKREHIMRQFYRLARQPAGLYVLIDYLNFKGEGLSSHESYHGQGWGLKQVLEEMPENTSDPIGEFVGAAKEILSQRVKNAPAERNEQKWLKGWHNRIETYRNFSI